MISFLSDIGNKRKLNEDFYGYIESSIRKVYIVADGMGGHNGGDIASKLAVESAIEYINNNKEETGRELLKNAFLYANKKVLTKAINEKKLQGMGTTLTLAMIENDKIFIAHVGDSSCYLLKDNNIKKITKDHSFVQYLVDAGSITENEAKSHPKKNIITRAIGTEENPDIDIYEVQKNMVQKILLCTDGLTINVDSFEIVEIIRKYSLDESVEKLVNLSKERGGQDNITVIIVGGVNNE